ncbi:MAG TPA: biotin--[acetyl-CoA-carboxylase] ligase [Candidatus Dormibacteraeota bacterium]|nr:biotin--[acetyl-CoA-carboxylase] ligase [Candidatus Dormibacteraeota bacterium]
MNPLSREVILPHLGTAWLGRELHCFEVLDSTNGTAREMAAAGAADGAVVIADAQRRGRGRLGREWVSPARKNLYVSVVLRCDLPPERLAQISLLAGVATCETIREWCPEAAIKWPNDILLGNRKTAGILAEMEQSRGQRAVILGIGVNLNSSAGDFPDELRDKATSLRLATGADVDRARFAGRLLTAIEARYTEWRRDGFAPIAAAWRALAPLIGRRIHVAEPSGTVEGEVLALDDDGALRIRCDDGTEHRVVAGDVTVIGGYAKS